MAERALLSKSLDFLSTLGEKGGLEKHLSVCPFDVSSRSSKTQKNIKIKKKKKMHRPYLRCNITESTSLGTWHMNFGKKLRSSPLVVQQTKDPVLSLQQLRLDPWPRNFCIPWALPKPKPTKQKTPQ